MRRFAKHTFVISILLVLVTSANAQEIEADLTASAILSRVTETYGNLDSYQDRGIVTTYILGETIRQLPERPFTTAFVRPGKFRFEYQDQFGVLIKRLRTAYIVWKDGENLAHYFRLEPEERSLESLDLGIAGATGVSGRSAHAIPSLLLPNLISGRKPTDIPSPARETDQIFDGYDCFIISGGTTTSSSKLWVSKDDFLIRKIEKYFNRQIEARSVIVYDPIVNISIDRELLEFDAPEL